MALLVAMGDDLGNCRQEACGLVRSGPVEDGPPPVRAGEGLARFFLRSDDAASQVAVLMPASAGAGFDSAGVPVSAGSSPAVSASVGAGPSASSVGSATAAVTCSAGESLACLRQAAPGGMAFATAANDFGDGARFMLAMPTGARSVLGCVPARVDSG